MAVTVTHVVATALILLATLLFGTLFASRYRLLSNSRQLDAYGKIGAMTQTYLPATADSLARLHTAEAIGTIVDTMRNAPKASERLKAAEMLIDRGHGRAVQAVISVPARQAVALKLASLGDAELLQIAKAGGGSTPEKGSPHAVGSAAGTILPPDADGLPLSVTGRSSQELDIVDAEFEEIDIDPCS